jgi:hypothetical protein
VPEPGWWSSFFAEPALELWRRAMSTDETAAEASDLARALQLAPAHACSTCPCGNGALRSNWRALGHRVRGLDAAREFVDEAPAPRPSGRTWSSSS